jgi:hypothetical protein
MIETSMKMKEIASHSIWASEFQIVTADETAESVYGDQRRLD